MVHALAATVVSTVFMGFAMIFLLLRCYCRFVIMKQVGVDDVLAIIGTLSSLVFTVCIFGLLDNGMGEKWVEVEVETKMMFLKYFWATIFTYGIAMAMVKSSALFQYLRFIKFSRMRVFCWIMIGIFLGFGVVTLIIDSFLCDPVEAFWNVTIPNARCLNMKIWFWFWAIYVIVGDIIIIAIPIITLKDMNLPRRQKNALLMVFAVGGFACLTSFIRLPTVYDFFQTGDLSKCEPGLVMWSSLELNIGVMCICTPPLKPIFNRLFPQFFESQASEPSSLQSQSSGWSGKTLKPVAEKSGSESSSSKSDSGWAKTAV